MSALLVSEVSTRRDYWRNTAVTLTKVQSSWRRIFVDRSYQWGRFWSLPLPDYGTVARDPLRMTESRDLGKDPFALCEGGFKRHGPKNILEEIWSGRISAA